MASSSFLAFLVLAQVLHRALIGLYAGEFQCRCGVDRFRDLDCGCRRRDAASIRAAIDFDQALECRAVLFRCDRKFGDVRNIIDADNDSRIVFR
jgi:hypothetical protein